MNNKKRVVFVSVIAALVLVAVVVLCVGVAVSGNDDNDTSTKKELTATATGMTVEESFGYYSVYITGKVVNTKKDYSYIAVYYYVYAADGTLLDTALDNNSGCPKDTTWTFSAIAFGMYSAKPSYYEFYRIVAY